MHEYAVIVVLRCPIYGPHESITFTKRVHLPFVPVVGLDIKDGRVRFRSKFVTWDLSSRQFEVTSDGYRTVTLDSLKDYIDKFLKAGWVAE
jgi:hypothetical protein